MNKVLSLLLFLFMFEFSSACAQVSLTPSQYSGDTTTTSGGVTGSHSFDNLEISWSITTPSQNGTQYYHYVYNITTTSGQALSPSQTYFLLQVSSAITSGNGAILNISPGLNESGPQTYTTSFGSFSNLPGSIYAIDLSTPSNPSSSYSFNSTSAPVWGNFYVQASNNHDWAYNTGFNSTPPMSGSYADWIATPGTPSPEPKTLLTLLTCLGIFFFFRSNSSKN